MASLSTIGIPEVAPAATAPETYQTAAGATGAPAGAFGAGTADALEGFGKTAIKTADFFNESVTDDQTNKFFEGSNKLLRGDSQKMVPGPDGQMVPDTGYMGLRGANALAARQQLEANLDQLYKETRTGLTTPIQQQKFDDQTRRQRQHVLGLAGSHADQEARSYATNVNKARGNIELTRIANNAENPDEVRAGLANLIDSRVKDAQILGGGPEMEQAAKEGALRDGTKTWLQAISANRPDMALALLEKNRKDVGPLYDELHREFRSRSDAQVGDKAGEKHLLSTYTTRAPAAVVLPVLTSVGDRYDISPVFLMRTFQMESGGQLNPPDSSTGAAGPFQVVGSTAKQYGLTDPHDFAAAADVTARLAVDNKRVLTNTLGRPPTDTELYLGHNQGGGGAGALLQNPMLTAQQALMTLPRYRNDPAGASAAARAIRVNGGDPNAPAANFTSMISAKFNGAGVAAANLASRKSEAYQSLESDPSLNDAQRDRARTYLNRTFQAMTIAEGITATAKKDANDLAADGYTKRLMSRDPKQMAGIYEQITADPNLDFRTRQAIGKMAEAASGSDVDAASQTYGPGFWEAWKSISAPADNPARITDSITLKERAGPGGDLTLAGYEYLDKKMKELKKNPDAQSIHSAKTSIMKGIASEMGREQLVPGFGSMSTNKRGMEKFNSDFLPQYEAAYSAWVGAGKDPWDFILNKDAAQKIMDRVYPRSERAKDSIAGIADAGASADKPGVVPPAPDGVNAKAWPGVLATSLATADGKPYPKAFVAEAIQSSLLKDTSSPEKIEEGIKLFNESKFGQKGGMDGRKILEQLGVIKLKPAVAAPAPAPAAAPEVSPVRRIMTEADRRMKEAGQYTRPGGTGSTVPPVN